MTRLPAARRIQRCAMAAVSIGGWLEASVCENPQSGLSGPPDSWRAQAPLALSNAAICAADSFTEAAFTRSPSCSGFEALAMGAVMLGRAIIQASATCVGVAAV